MIQMSTVVTEIPAFQQKLQIIIFNKYEHSHYSNTQNPATDNITLRITKYHSHYCTLPSTKSQLKITLNNTKEHSNYRNTQLPATVTNNTKLYK